MHSSNPLAPGTLLLAPTDAGERAADVLCVLDQDPAEPGAVFALLLTQPTDQPAQPLTFGIFDCGADVAWWGGPTQEPFALARLSGLAGGADEVDLVRPDGAPRVFVTERTALYLPGRDHPPARPPEAVRVFLGSVWLPAENVELYRSAGQVLAATDKVLFDSEPETLAGRLRDLT